MRFPISYLCFMLFLFGFAASSFVEAGSFSRALEQPVGVSWDGVPFRDACERLQEQTGVPIWVDSRVVPNAPLTGNFQNATLPQILREALYSEFLTDQKLEITQCGDLLYIGPRSFAERVQTLCELKRLELQESLSKSEQKHWLVPTAISWERLDTPKTILKSLAEKQHVKVSGFKAIPHDLWPKKRLPSVPTLDAFLLILGQYNLTLNFTKNGAEIVPLDLSEVVLTKSYTAKQISESRLNMLEKVFPETKIKQGSTKISVRGIMEAHEFLTAKSDSSPNVGAFSKAQLGGGTAEAGRTPEGVSRTEQVFSLSFTAPFWPAIKQLCKQQDLTLEADTDALVAAGIDLAKIVTVDVKQVSLEEVFVQIAAAAGCKAKLVGNKIIVEP